MWHQKKSVHVAVQNSAHGKRGNETTHHSNVTVTKRMMKAYDEATSTAKEENDH